MASCSLIFSRRYLLPHELYSNTLSHAEEEFLLGSDLLKAINGFSEYDTPYDTKKYDQEAFDRSVADLMAFDEVALKTLKKINTRQEKRYDQEGFECSEKDLMAFDALTLKNFKKIDSNKRYGVTKEEEEKEEVLDEYENEMEAFYYKLTEKRVKKTSNKWCRVRSLSRKKKY